MLSCSEYVLTRFIAATVNDLRTAIPFLDPRREAQSKDARDSS